MKVGFVLVAEDDVPRAAAAAEAEGFEYLACGDHLTYRRATWAPIVALSGAAAVTQRIRLLTDVLVLPLYPPVVLAKMAASLDVLSGGRLDLGIGVGEHDKDFEAAGVRRSERGARTDEALAVMLALLSGGPTSHKGRFNSFSDVTLDPPPIQRPPPIWVGGRSDLAVRRAALHGGWLPYLFPADHLPEKVALYRSAARAAGRPADSLRVGVHVWVTVHREPGTAREIALALANRTYGQDFTRFIDTHLVVGTPDTCIQRLLAYGGAGADLVLAMISCPPEQRPAMTDLFVKEVLPHISSPRGAGGD